MRTRLLTFVALLLAAAPAAAEGDGLTYVFFDWGKTELSEDARASLDVVAAAFGMDGKSIRLDGYSDRSGGAAGNLERSRERARLVRGALIEGGVPANAITIVAHGEAHPLVETADGVREVQNRRVEIRLTRER